MSIETEKVDKNKLRLLDLFCGEGGASYGYSLAGFEVTGVDSISMPRYPFKFIQADCLSLNLDFLSDFDVIAASPPCKVHTSMKKFSATSHKDLIPETRSMLIASGRPYVIENVPGAPLIDPIMLCGSMFGMDIQRHRYFESNVPIYGLGSCLHEEQPHNKVGYQVKQYHSGAPDIKMSRVVSVYGRGNGYGCGETKLWREVMCMPWASKDGLREAIPPYYTEFIGEQIISYLRCNNDS